ncbi:MAG TPA: LuxR C-terminal-related transcriptional regulator [Kofleriaceae bacterium]|nr:LuxR C-terminal-related transcriptional regulator [Kofleriaceae bacterium]
MSGEVPAKLFGFMREVSRRAGSDVDAAQAGLALRDVDVDASGARVDWDDVARFLERAHGRQTVEQIERVGEMYVQTHVWQQIIARVVGTPRLMYELCMGPLCRAAFPHLDVSVHSSTAGVHVEFVLPRRYEPSLVFFRSTVGEVRMMTTIIGRPQARVVADVGERHGVYDIELDEPPTTLDRAVRATARSYDAVATEAVRLMQLAVSARPPNDEPPNVVDLQRRFGLTRMEARVTARLATGLSVKDIGAALDIRVSTVRTHLKSAYAKTSSRGQTDLIRLVLTGDSRLA